MAENLGVDLDELAESRPGRKIGKSDVAAAASAVVSGLGADEESIAISGMRAVIAERMLQSSQTTAPVTLTTEADATELVALRARLKVTLGERGKVVPSFNDLFVKLTALALVDHPELNARWNDSEIILSKSVHMGVAVDVNGGLLVPVIRDAEKKSVLWIAQETRDLAEKAREGRLSPDAMQGGTFTISNLGNFGIDAFTPVINLPQCAILGIGRIAKRPAVRNGAVVPRDLVTLSLTFDHRVVDGAPAARFLQTISESVEQPDAWLVG
jgi:pyruvate dehydrogenase E2 component (dihydrolipoamide acetyltransferase)